MGEFLNWLETRASELQPTHSDQFNRTLRKEPRRGENRKHPQKRMIFQTNENNKEPKSTPENKSEKTKKCMLCGGNHKVTECFKFIRECAKARTEIVKTLKLCFKCLLKHQLGICDKEDCNYCGGPHNVMLCYRKENEAARQRAQQKRFDCNLDSNQQNDNWNQPSTSKNSGQ